jgi:hypothetical protein
MAWVAFNRAIRDVERFGLEGPADRWRVARNDVASEVLERGFDAETGSFMQSYGSSLLDASLLIIPLVGFLPADDERMLSTIAAIEPRLLHDGFVYCYEHDPTVDGLSDEEASFLACTFWYVDCLNSPGVTTRPRRRSRERWACATTSACSPSSTTPLPGPCSGPFPTPSPTSPWSTPRTTSRRGPGPGGTPETRDRRAVGFLGGQGTGYVREAAEDASIAPRVPSRGEDGIEEEEGAVRAARDPMALLLSGCFALQGFWIVANTITAGGKATKAVFQIQPMRGQNDALQQFFLIGVQDNDHLRAGKAKWGTNRAFGGPYPLPVVGNLATTIGSDCTSNGFNLGNVTGVTWKGFMTPEAVNDRTRSTRTSSCRSA